MIEVYLGDITALDVDCLVNAANSRLVGGGGVDGAIHRAAGPELLAWGTQLDGCPTGQARLSPGFALPARWVIHTVGPVWAGGQNREAELLASCYENSFTLALAHGIRTIAVPAISTGVYGYPKEAAAAIAVKAMRRFESRFERIVACCFSRSDAELYALHLSGF